MAEFNGGDVVVVPMPATLGAVSVPVAPDMVIWALPGPSGEIPYAAVEALVDAEVGERIDTMTTLESSTVQASEAAATAAGTASTAASQAVTARGEAVTAAGTATTAAGSAVTAASTATEAAEIAEQYALEFDLDVSSTTGAPGSQASATVAGDGPAYQINIVVPQGARGPKGDNGEISQAQLDAAVASLVDNAPEALDTLTELAAALGNDPNFATTVSTEIGKRVLIDGAPAEYNTLGKLVIALQNHELGGSTDASVLEGALTDQIDASAATVLLDYGNPGGPETVPISGAFGMLQYLVEAAHYAASLNAPAVHTHDGADITGALTDAVDISEAIVQIGSGQGSLGSNMAWIQQEISGKAATSHTHTWSQISNAPAYSKDATGDNLVQRASNGHINVPAGAGAQNAIRRSEVEAAINAKIQLVTDFPASPTAGVLYLKAE